MWLVVADFEHCILYGWPQYSKAKQLWLRCVRWHCSFKFWKRRIGRRTATDSGSSKHLLLAANVKCRPLICQDLPKCWFQNWISSKATHLKQIPACYWNDSICCCRFGNPFLLLFWHEASLWYFQEILCSSISVGLSRQQKSPVKSANNIATFSFFVPLSPSWNWPPAHRPIISSWINTRSGATKVFTFKIKV